MNAPGPVVVAQLSVPVESGMFNVTDPTLGDLEATEEGLTEATESSRFVAVVRDVLTVVTPAEDSVGTPVTIQVWDRLPDPHDLAADEADEAAADHEVELDIDVASGRLEVWLVSGSAAEVDAVPPGAYRVRVSGRGFTPFDEFDGVNRESYRLVLWPRTEPEPPVVTRRWPGWEQY